MKDPSNPGATPPPPPSDPPEKQWADVKGMENLHFLSASNFDTFLQDHKSALVMFYAPCTYSSHLCTGEKSHHLVLQQKYMTCTSILGLIHAY